MQPTPPLTALASESWLRSNHELVLSLTAGVLLILAWSGERWLDLPHGVEVTMYVISCVLGAFDLARHTWGTVRAGKFPFNIDLLMLLAAIGASLLGEWAEAAFLLFLFSLAHALEEYATDRARRAIQNIAELAPPTAHVRRDGRETDVPIETVKVGDLVIVRPGDRIPVDGVIVSGRSAVNQAPVTGESVPVDKQPNAPVFAGSVNGEGALDIKTTGIVGDRTLDRIIALVTEAQAEKSPTQRFTERFERVYVPVVLVAAVLVIVVPALVSWWTWQTSFYRGMAMLVAASPCALALSTPVAMLAGIAQAARKGVLIKGGAHLESLANIRTMAFDKTGTLTVGLPEVTDIVTVDGATEHELLRIAGAAEQRSQHPLARAVVRRAESSSLTFPEAGELQSVTARGVRSHVEGEVVEIGNIQLWQDDGVDVPVAIRDGMSRLQQQGRSVMAVRHGSKWLGVLGLADQPREGAKGILDDLRRLGIARNIMLTGDNRGVAEAVAEVVGVDEVRAELMPEDKVSVIRELMANGERVAMVGDGINDAPALATATIGIAMGGAGTATALETADAALMGDDIGRLPFAVGLARRAKSIVRQNLLVSLATIALLLTATVTGVIGLGPAVIVHEGSTLLVVFNALRLLTYDRADLSKQNESGGTI